MDDFPMPKITKRVADALAPPESGQTLLRDSEVKGFGLRVTAGGVKSFFFEKRIEGRVRRKTIGRYGIFTVEQARQEAIKRLREIDIGRNPIQEMERSHLRGTTLEKAFEDYLKARKNLKPTTVYIYKGLMAAAFANWQTKPLDAITKDMVAERHREIGETSGKTHANLAMRLLRSLFNFAMEEYEDSFGEPLLADNPVMRLTRTRAWYPSVRRQTVIKPHELPAWYQGVQALKKAKAPLAGTAADYLIFLLFTGLRREEAVQLPWREIDLRDKTLRIPDPKNREPFILPLSDFLVSLLEERKKSTKSPFVFPGRGKKGYLAEPKHHVQNVIKASGISFTLHDLRRTFITIAESLEIGPYAIKRLVNHKMNGDVTAGYIVSSVERLREPMQRVTDYLQTATGMNPGK